LPERNGFGALPRFNADERTAPQAFELERFANSSIHKGLPICNPLTSNAALPASHQSPADGGFDENDVLVAVSLSVMVLHAYPHRQAL
jgi:hypothetical protein